MRRQTLVLRLFRLACSDASRFKEFSNFLINTIKSVNSKTHVIVEDSKVVICEDSQCSKNVTLRYSGRLNLSYSSKDLLKLVTSIVVKFLATDGVKKIVLLFKENSDGKYVKVSNVLKPCEGLSIKLAAHAPTISFLISIIVALLIVTLYNSVLLSLAVATMSSALATMLFTGVLMSRLHALELTGCRLLKVEIWYSHTVPESRINALLRLLRRFDVVENPVEQIRTVTETLLGEYLVKVRYCQVEVKDPVKAILSRRKVRLLLVNAENPEAFSLVVPLVCRCIVLTSKLVALLENEELQAVIAHELGHIVNRDHVNCLLLTMLNAVIVYGLYIAVIRLGLPLVYGFTIFTTYVMSVILLVRYLSRRAEIRADRYAIGVVGPLSLIMALIRVAWKSLIAELNSYFTYLISKAFSSHPPVIDRLRLAVAML